jgi:putative transposase
VLRYLGRYTHRVAISNHRLVSFADQKVTFRWRDSAHNNEQRLLTLSLDEFLRRFLLHLLPDSFVRIRNFGLLANRRRATFLPLCFSLLGSAPQTQQETSGAKDSTDLWLCPKCAWIERVGWRVPTVWDSPYREQCQPPRESSWGGYKWAATVAVGRVN